MHKLNLEIWREIIACLAYPQDQQTLRALALTSRRLSVLALNTIWEDGKRLPRIISVINSFAPPPNGPFLEYVRGEWDDEDEDDEEEEEKDENNDSEDGTEEITPFSREPGNWVQLHPVPPTACLRASEYLARIRKLTISRYQQAGELKPLWTVLSHCLGCEGSILPNMRCLEITVPAHLDDEIYDRFNDQVMSTVLNLVRTKGCDLKVFTYEGGLIQDLPGIVASFKNLQDIKLGLYRLPKRNSSLTFIEFLASLPSLCSLACDLDSFATCKDKNASFRHTTLKRIDLHSTTKALGHFFRSCVFPSVTNARIANGNKVPTFIGLESSFPKVQELKLSIGLLVGHEGSPPIKLPHLASLLSLPIRAFTLEVVGCHHNLAVCDLHTIVDSWPDLRSFKLCSDTDFRDLSSLASFSHHPSLESLDLHLPVHCLLEDTSRVSDLIGAHSITQGHMASPLYTLFFTIPGLYAHRQDAVIPSTAEKQMFVEYLLLLFPSLRELGLVHCLHHPLPKDNILPELQGILQELRNKRKDSSDNLV